MNFTHLSYSSVTYLNTYFCLIQFCWIADWIKQTVLLNPIPYQGKEHCFLLPASLGQRILAQAPNHWCLFPSPHWPQHLKNVFGRPCQTPADQTCTLISLSGCKTQVALSWQAENQVQVDHNSDALGTCHHTLGLSFSSAYTRHSSCDLNAWISNLNFPNQLTSCFSSVHWGKKVQNTLFFLIIKGSEQRKFLFGPQWNSTLCEIRRGRDSGASEECTMGSHSLFK